MDTKEKRKPGPKPTGHTPPRSIRVSQAEWSAWQVEASARGVTVTDLLRAGMRRLLSRSKPRPAAERVPGGGAE